MAAGPWDQSDTSTDWAYGAQDKVTTDREPEVVAEKYMRYSSGADVK